MRQSLILYTRPDCELCREAEALIAEAGFDVIHRDISVNLEWLRQYRDRIPVVTRPEGGPELGWPFDLDSLRRWIEADA